MSSIALGLNVIFVVAAIFLHSLMEQQPMIKHETLAQVSAFPGWIVGISCSEALVYRCWVMSADLDVFSDGEFYDTCSAAMAAGRHFVGQ